MQSVGTSAKTCSAPQCKGRELNASLPLKTITKSRPHPAAETCSVRWGPNLIFWAFPIQITTPDTASKKSTTTQQVFFILQHARHCPHSCRYCNVWSISVHIRKLAGYMQKYGRNIRRVRTEGSVRIRYISNVDHKWAFRMVSKKIPLWRS